MDKGYLWTEEKALGAHEDVLLSRVSDDADDFSGRELQLDGFMRLPPNHQTQGGGLIIRQPLRVRRFEPECPHTRVTFSGSTKRVKS